MLLSRSCLAALSAATVVAGIAAATVAPSIVGASPARSAAVAGSAATGTIRLVTGGSVVTDTAHHVWLPDTPYALGGQFSHTAANVGGTSEPELFHFERYGMQGYHVPVANGTYQVTLYMAEHYWTGKGQRVFDVTAEGTTVLSGVDTIAAVGRLREYSRTFTVTVADGALDLGYVNRVDVGTVSALMIAKRPTATTPIPPSTTPVPPSTTPAPPSTTPVPPPTTPAPAPVARTVTPESFGARGDGVTDDTLALQRAFDSAPAGVAVVLANGRTYAHSGVLHLRTAGLHVTGTGVLAATAAATSSVWIEADNVVLDGGLTVRGAATSQRWAAWEQMGIRLVGHSGAVLRNITVEQSAAAGVYVGGATGFLLDHVTVQNTQADGIHMTEGANNGRVVSPLIRNSGDDGVAVVSYGADGTPCHDIIVTSPTVLGTTWGRGLSVVGGNRITETGIDVRNSSAAGVYVAAEGSPWFSAAPTNVSISGGQIVGANTDSSIDHGAVVVLAGENGPTPQNVAISNLTISGTRSTASRDVGVITYGTDPHAVSFSNFVITGGPRSAYSGNTPSSSYTIRDWTVNGAPMANQG